MVPPQSLLDALSDSISSGTFIDTKFYVFSRRDTSGRVGSPRALYCNSSILGTVSYFSSLFSDGFSEAQVRDINGGFPADLYPYAEEYDYLSDSDLEDEEGSCHSEEDEELTETVTLRAVDSNSSPPRSPSVRSTETRSDNSDPTPRMGKIAVIQDVGAVTFEALLYFLYTGEIKFAPLSSGSRRGLSAQAGIGEWDEGGPPSQSAKSIYRLADKYDIPALKERARIHIRDNLEHCDIVEEIFSSFTSFFPEILSMQVSHLVKKLSEESKRDAEGGTRRQLQNKIASLSKLQARRATDALVMICNCGKGPLEPPETHPESVFSAATGTSPPNWHRMKLAFLKSITTGVFIDVQFYAYNEVSNDMPRDPRPLFISSIVIEKLGPVITTQTVGIDSKGACLIDGPVDDYEGWDDREPSSEIYRDEETLKYWTEATTSQSGEIVLLVSGAWKTWMSLFSCLYHGRISFSPLPSSVNHTALAVQTHRSQSWSPRSAYSLAMTLGIKTVGKAALTDIQSKLTDSNIMQELFSSFTASYKAVMEMEIEFFHENFIERHPRLLADHIQRMTSGEAPFFPTTLGFVCDKFIENAFPPQS